MEIKDIINIAAIVLSPIIAVVVTIFLQNRSDKKKEKIAIIKSLLSTGHYLYSDEIIRSYNLIDIVFKDDKDVRAKWKLYYEALCNESLQYQVRLDKKLDLILAMCKSVNYKILPHRICREYMFLRDSLRMAKSSENIQICNIKVWNC